MHTRFPLLRSRIGFLSVTATMLFLIPCSLFAADVADVLKTPDQTFVTRGEFIRAAVKLLGIPEEAGATLPYRRVPKNLEKVVSAAYARGALATFGKELFPGQPVNLGQALEVLTVLKGLTADSAEDYRDLNGATAGLKRAVQAALDQQWVEPKSSSIFGVKDLLTGKEARILLRKVMGEGGAEDGGTQEDAIPTIRIEFKSPGSQPAGELPKSQILEALWKIVNDDYLYSDKISQEDAAYRAAEGLVESLNDPYSTFFRPATARNFQTRINGEISGIGAQVEDRAGVLTIVTPLTGSPAEKAGLKPNDEILSVDGVSIVGLPYEEAVDKVRGPKGSPVKLHIRRNGSEFDVSVIRDMIKVPEIDVKWREQIAVVQLMQFGKLTDTDLRSIMQDVAKKKPLGVILDLRNNPGGLLHAADVVVSNFLPVGSPVSIIKSRTGEKTEVTDLPATIDASVPMVVLVNKGSASASEIVAGALQDAGRATVVGEQSFGKGTVQEILEFSDHSSLKLTIAEWLTPKRRKIDGIGVKPDIIVPASERDDQLLKAVDIIKRTR
ncbi:MAG: S41 family peptidase [Candidatus Peribacteraceae bacterium]|nr:S41 family peptidase [Candidatus Peribacteraceae bacterium]MDD5074777.1 S41 family peptidase [Candidatus Peribacteraceae bacterium]